MSWVFCKICGTTNHNTTSPSTSNLHLYTDEQWIEQEFDEGELIWKCYNCESYLIGEHWYLSETELSSLLPDWEPKVKPACSNCGSTEHGGCNKEILTCRKCQDVVTELFDDVCSSCYMLIS